MSDEKKPMVDDEIIDPDDMFLTVDLDDGTTETFQIIQIFEVNGQNYIAVCPLEQGEEEVVYFYRHYEDVDGNPFIDNIESDEEFDMVTDRFDELLDEMEFEEM